MACKVHPNYQAIRKPKISKNFAKGCPDCWKLYNEKNGEEEQAPVKEPKKNSKQKKSKEVQPEAKRAKRRPKARSIEEPAVAPRKPVEQKHEGLSEECTSGCACKSEAKASPLSWKDISVKFKSELDALVDEVAERKIVEAKTKIAAALHLEYEHMFIEDEQWHRNVLTNLEKEGWQWMHYTYPLAKSGIIKKDYHLLKRVKMSGQKAAPDLLDEKTMKRYKKL